VINCRGSLTHVCLICLPFRFVPLCAFAGGQGTFFPLRIYRRTRHFFPLWAFTGGQVTFFPSAHLQDWAPQRNLSLQRRVIWMSRLVRAFSLAAFSFACLLAEYMRCCVVQNMKMIDRLHGFFSDNCTTSNSMYPSTLSKGGFSLYIGTAFNSCTGHTSYT
jgi:hypothetical protein